MFQDIQAEDDIRIGHGKPNETNEPRAIQSASTSQKEYNFAHPPLRTKRNAKRKLDEDDKKEEEAISFLRVAANELSAKDEFTIFGQMVASQLRKLNQRNQAIGKNRIQNCLFELEMEEINTASSKQNDILQSPADYSSPLVSPYSEQSPSTATSPDYSQPSTPQRSEYQDVVVEEIQEFIVLDT